MGTVDVSNDIEYDVDSEFGKNLKILPSTDQIKELQTILRDRNTSRSDFKFYADRLIRLVIEESLNQLPFSRCEVITPTGAKYEGLKYRSGNCGVSIVRSGEAMEQGLRDCCRSIRIGKILVESDPDTYEARVVYARFPEDIARRQVLLMYPIMSTGNTVIQSVNVLKEHGVNEECIILSNLFCTPAAAKTVVSAFPKLQVGLTEKGLLFMKTQSALPENIHWVRAIKFADDCHSYNTKLVLQKCENATENLALVLETTRPVRTGHELLLWFSEDILANLQISFLTPANIQGQKKYVCHVCSATFEYPNPLKLHLTLDCNRQDISHLWQQLVKLIKNLPPETSSSLSKPPFTINLFTREHYSILNLSKSTTILNISEQNDSILNKRSSTSPIGQPQRPLSEPATLHSSAFKPYNLTKKTSQNNNTIRLTQSVSNFSSLSRNFTQNITQNFGATQVISNSVSDISFNHAAQMETLVSNLGKSKQGHLCIYCGKCYSRKYGLKIHIRTHTGYKPLKCKYCLRPFGDPSNLNKHVRLHAEGDTPYKCDLCGKVLVRRRDLERHLKSRHLENFHEKHEPSTSSSEQSD